MAWMAAAQQRTVPVPAPTSGKRDQPDKHRTSTRTERYKRRKSSDAQKLKSPNSAHQIILEKSKAPLGSSTSTQPPSLTISLQQQPKSVNGVPIIVESCLQYFANNATACVGLFRAPGNERNVQEMWDYMCNRPCARLSINCMDTYMRKHPDSTANDVASFMKRFLTSIVGKEPVLTYNCYAPLANLTSASAMCPSHLIGEKARRIIGQLLVPARRALLGRLCNFLREFSRHAPKTTMDCASLSVCFAHLIQAPPEGHGQPSPHIQSKRELPSKQSQKTSRTPSAESASREREQVKICASIIEILIKRSRHVFAPCLSPPRPPRSSSKTTSLFIRRRHNSTVLATGQKKLTPTQMLRKKQTHTLSIRRFMAKVNNLWKEEGMDVSS